MYPQKNTPKRFSTPLIALASALLLAACGSPDPDDNGNNNETPAAQAPGELLEGSQPRDEDPEVDDQTFQDFTTHNRDFSFSIFDELRQAGGDDQNVFLSPHSISLALAMTYGGALENTKAEMSEALRFLLPDEDLHSSFNKLDLALATRSDFEPEEEEDVAFDLDIVNQTWGHETFPFIEDYLDLLSRYYGAGLYAVNFESDFEQIRQEINQWVEDRTQERIQDLLPEDSLDSDTRFVLVNAIYFYGSWKHPFEKNLTSDADFTRLDGSTVEVPMMGHSELINTLYFEDDDTVAVSLPYVGDDVSMIAFMPADESDDFLTWENNFDRQSFVDAVA